MEGRSKRLGEMELDAARALAEMAKIEVGSEEGWMSSRKRIKKKSKARACGESSRDLNISRSEITLEEPVDYSGEDGNDRSSGEDSSNCSYGLTALDESNFSHMVAEEMEVGSPAHIAPVEGVQLMVEETHAESPSPTPAVETVKSPGVRRSITVELVQETPVTTSALKTAVVSSLEASSSRVRVLTAEARQILSVHAPVITTVSSASMVAVGTEITPHTPVVTTPSSSRILGTPTRSMSTRARDSLIALLIGQFNSMMELCANLVISEEISFDFIRSLLDNYVENIRILGGDESATVYQAQVDKLGEYSIALYNFEHADVVSAVNLALVDMVVDHSRYLEEVEKQIEDQSRYLDGMRASYDNALLNYRKAELSTKQAEEMMAAARENIAKAQLILQDNQHILKQEKKNMEQFSVQSNQLYNELKTRSQELEIVRADYVVASSINEEEMRCKALETAEEIRQRELARVKDQIRYLTRQV